MQLEHGYRSYGRVGEIPEELRGAMCEIGTILARAGEDIDAVLNGLSMFDEGGPARVVDALIVAQQVAETAILIPCAMNVGTLK